MLGRSEYELVSVLDDNLSGIGKEDGSIYIWEGFGIKFAIVASHVDSRLPFPSLLFGLENSLAGGIILSFPRPNLLPT